jgi:hypothetical protein
MTCRVGKLNEVSITDSGGPIQRHSNSRPALSATERFVAFWSEATNLVAEIPMAVVIYSFMIRYLRQTRRISLANDGSSNAASAVNFSLSADGTDRMLLNRWHPTFSNDPIVRRMVFVHHIVYTCRSYLIDPVSGCGYCLTGSQL